MLSSRLDAEARKTTAGWDDDVLSQALGVMSGSVPPTSILLFLGEGVRCIFLPSCVSLSRASEAVSGGDTGSSRMGELEARRFWGRDVEKGGTSELSRASLLETSGSCPAVVDCSWESQSIMRPSSARGADDNVMDIQSKMKWIASEESIDDMTARRRAGKDGLGYFTTCDNTQDIWLFRTYC